MEHQPTPQHLPEALLDAVLASPDVQDFLNDVAAPAGRELSEPGEPAHCAVTLIRPSATSVVASSTGKARLADELQYEFRDGPCLTAATTGTMVEVTDFHTDQRWPAYFQEAAAHGIGAVLAVPIPLPGKARSAINLYATGKHHFSDLEILTLQGFAAQASTAVQVALRTEHMQSRFEDLTAATTERSMIDMATGIIMRQLNCSQEAAFTVLRETSNGRNESLREVAAALVASVDGAGTKTPHLN